ncbi:MAG: DUF1670 domain-containing protein [Ardenticatenaceae bacterium]|nr:DUF1670 domain-containing protein [Ardenticatenaceae bacterium]
MEEAVVDRLAAKSPEEAIIEQITRDFNLAPFMARTQFEPMRRYVERYLGLKRNVGQVSFVAVSANVPPGQAVEACERVAITLRLDSEDDLEALRHGVAALRRSKIQRLTREAQEQGAVLTQEDLARLLCSSRSSIKRDVAALRAAGVDVPTRGPVKDIGRGVSPKTQIVSDWLAGDTFSQIKSRRWHAIRSIERSCRDFHRVARLVARGLDVAAIRQSTGVSERRIREYVALYEEAGGDNERLRQLLADPDKATTLPAEIKRGAWLK